MAWTNSAFDRILKDEEDSERFYTFYNNNRELLEYLMSAFEAKIKDSESATDSKDLYKSPNWGLEQADQVGYRRGLKDGIYLLDFQEKSKVE